MVWAVSYSLFVFVLLGRWPSARCEGAGTVGGASGHGFGAGVDASNTTSNHTAPANPSTLPHDHTALGELLRVVAKNLEDPIKEERSAVQTRVLEAIQVLRRTTDKAVEAFGEAKKNDRIYSSCVQSEKLALETHAGCMRELEEVRTKRHESCEGVALAQNHSQDVPPDIVRFKCTFPHEAEQCLALLRNWTQESVKKLNDARAVFQERHRECTRFTSRHSAKASSCTRLQETFSRIRSGCSDHASLRRQRLCDFQRAFRRKCAAKAAYLSLVGEVSNGNAISETALTREWSSTQTLKCLLNKLRLGYALDDASRAGCPESTSYEDSVGSVDFRHSEFEMLTSQEKFSCQEASFSFSGTGWTTPGVDGDELRPSSYVPQTGHTEAYPFPFCPYERPVLMSGISFGDRHQFVATAIGVASCPRGYTAITDKQECRAAADFGGVGFEDHSTLGRCRLISASQKMRLSSQNAAGAKTICIRVARAPRNVPTPASSTPEAEDGTAPSALPSLPPNEAAAEAASTTEAAGDATADLEVEAASQEVGNNVSASSLVPPVLRAAARRSEALLDFAGVSSPALTEMVGQRQVLSSFPNAPQAELGFVYPGYDMGAIPETPGRKTLMRAEKMPTVTGRRWIAG